MTIMVNNAIIHEGNYVLKLKNHMLQYIRIMHG